MAGPFEKPLMVTVRSNMPGEEGKREYEVRKRELRGTKVRSQYVKKSQSSHSWEYRAGSAETEAHAPGMVAKAIAVSSKVICS